MAYTPTPLNNAAQLQKAPWLSSFLKTNVSSPVDERKIDYSPKEIQFLSQLKKKWIPMQQAFSFLEKKRLENPDYFQQQQMKPAKDFLWSVVAKVPQYFGNMLWGAAERSAQSVENVRQTMWQNMWVSVPVNPVSPQQAGQQVVDIGTQGRQNLEWKLGVDPTSTASSLGRWVSSLWLTYLLGEKSWLNKGISSAFSAVKDAPTFAKALPEVAKLGTLWGIENMAYAKWDIGKADARDFGFWFVGTNIFAGLPFAKKVISKIPVPWMIKSAARRLEVSGAMNAAKYEQLNNTLLEEWVDLSRELSKSNEFWVADWLLKRDVKWDIPEQVSQTRQIAKDSQAAKKTVLNQSNTLHKDKYTKGLLDDLAEELKDSRSPERQAMFEKVTNWKQQWDNVGLRLTDMDDIRWMWWEVLSPFTSSWAVRIAKADLRWVISAVKRYIEKAADAEELGKTLGYQWDNLIRDLNNQTQIANGIADAMSKKDVRSFSQDILSFFATRSISTSVGAIVWLTTDIWPFDANTLGGKVGNAMFWAIVGTFGGSPALKTKLAQWLDNLSGKQKSQVYEWIKSKGTKNNIEVEKQLNKLGKSLDFKNKNAVTWNPISQSLSTPTPSSLSTSQSSDTLSSSADSSLGAPATLKSNEWLSIPKKLPWFIGEKPTGLPVKEAKPSVKVLYRAWETSNDKWKFGTDDRALAELYWKQRDLPVSEMKIDMPSSQEVYSTTSQIRAYIDLFPDTFKSKYLQYVFLDEKPWLEKWLTYSRWEEAYAKTEFLKKVRAYNSKLFREKGIDINADDWLYNFVSILDKELKKELEKRWYKLAEYTNPWELWFETVPWAKEYLVLDDSIIQWKNNIPPKETPKLPLKTAWNGEQVSKKVSLEKKAEETIGITTISGNPRVLKSKDIWESVLYHGTTLKDVPVYKDWYMHLAGNEDLAKGYMDKDKKLHKKDWVIYKLRIKPDAKILEFDAKGMNWQIAQKKAYKIVDDNWYDWVKFINMRDYPSSTKFDISDLKNTVTYAIKNKDILYK